MSEDADCQHGLAPSLPLIVSIKSFYISKKRTYCSFFGILLLLLHRVVDKTYRNPDAARLRGAWCSRLLDVSTLSKQDLFIAHCPTSCDFKWNRSRRYLRRKEAEP